jgi:hypothetical protein
VQAECEPRRRRTSGSTERLLPTTVRRSEPLPSIFKFKKCWHCEPGFGIVGERCEATMLFEANGLEAELQQQIDKISRDVRAPALTTSALTRRPDSSLPRR